MLLEALGDDDPAEVQATTPATLRALLAEAGDDLRTQPSPGEWSVLECVGHILDGELVMAARYRWVLAQDEPQIVGYDQALWVERLRHGSDDRPSSSGSSSRSGRRTSRCGARTTEIDRARIGVHSERGTESFDLMVRMLGGHDRVHLAQARAALAAVRATRP